MRIFLLALLCSALFSSCFEIIEEVNLNADGSGSLSYTLNLSQSKTKINAALLLDSIKGVKIPDESEIRSRIEEVKKKLEEVEGLSNIITKEDFSEYIFSFSCDFKSIEDLNEASIHLKESYNVEGSDLAADDHFSYDSDSKTFNRKGDYKAQADTEGIDSEERESLNTAEFTAIYRFENEISSASHPKAKISPSKKASMLKLKAIDLANGKETLENSIILK